MAIDKKGRLSGAYIRSLVKQNTSPKPLSTNSTTTNNEIISDGDGSDNNSNIGGEKLDMAKQPTQPQQHGGQQGGGGHKKQVRRRLHTSRPYQERLLNMAEARKEIVTALKFHRAAMKQANEIKHQQQQQQQQHLPDQHHPHFTVGVVDHEEVPNISNFSSSSFANTTYNYPSYNNHNGYYPWNINISSSTLSNEPPPINYHETLNIPLPNQTLGLNLNLQAFTNLDTSFTLGSVANTIPSILSPSSSSSSAPGDPATTGPITEIAGAVPTGTHPALDEEEMAEIRSIGEKHQIEWDDTLNLVKSAWWLKYLKKVDFGNNNNNNNMEMKEEEERDEYEPFGEFMEFPAWLSANEGFLQQHLDHCSPQDYCKDTSLPWMDIGDIDGMDDEWLS